MKLNHVVKLPGERPYQMRQFEWEICTDDLPEELVKTLTVHEEFCVLQFLLIYQAKQIEILYSNTDKDAAKHLCSVAMQIMLPDELLKRVKEYGLLPSTKYSPADTNSVG